MLSKSSSINGLISDGSGSAIANAQVTLTDAGQGTVFSAITNSTGEYSIPALQAGTYQPARHGRRLGEIRSHGYRAAGISDGKSRRKADGWRSNFKGRSKMARRWAQWQTESPEISFTITGKQITQLVLNGRNFSQLVTLSPGVIYQTGQDEGETGVAGSVAYSINGGRTGV